MNYTIDDVMGNEEDEEECDAAVFQVQDELGLNLTDELKAPIHWWLGVAGGKNKQKLQPLPW